MARPRCMWDAKRGPLPYGEYCEAWAPGPASDATGVWGPLDRYGRRSVWRPDGCEEGAPPLSPSATSTSSHARPSCAYWPVRVLAVDTRLGAAQPDNPVAASVRRALEVGGAGPSGGVAGRGGCEGAGAGGGGGKGGKHGRQRGAAEGPVSAAACAVDVAGKEGDAEAGAGPCEGASASASFWPPVASSSLFYRVCFLAWTCVAGDGSGGGGGGGDGGGGGESGSVAGAGAAGAGKSGEEAFEFFPGHVTIVPLELLRPIVRNEGGVDDGRGDDGGGHLGPATLSSLSSRVTAAHAQWTAGAEERAELSIASEYAAAAGAYLHRGREEDAGLEVEGAISRGRAGAGAGAAGSFSRGGIRLQQRRPKDGIRALESLFVEPMALDGRKEDISSGGDDEDVGGMGGGAGDAEGAGGAGGAGRWWRWRARSGSMRSSATGASGGGGGQPTLWHAPSRGLGGDGASGIGRGGHKRKRQEDPPSAPRDAGEQWAPVSPPLSPLSGGGEAEDGGPGGTGAAAPAATATAMLPKTSKSRKPLPAGVNAKWWSRRYALWSRFDGKPAAAAAEGGGAGADGALMPHGAGAGAGAGAWSSTARGDDDGGADGLEGLGAALDADSWWSMTPERAAQRMARACVSFMGDSVVVGPSVAGGGGGGGGGPGAPIHVLDLFAGVGGNTIAFARTPGVAHVCGLELMPSRCAMHVHNAKLYDVDARRADASGLGGPAAGAGGPLPPPPWDAARLLLESAVAGSALLAHAAGGPPARITAASGDAMDAVSYLLGIDPAAFAGGAGGGGGAEGAGVWAGGGGEGEGGGVHSPRSAASPQSFALPRNTLLFFAPPWGGPAQSYASGGLYSILRHMRLSMRTRAMEDELQRALGAVSPHPAPSAAHLAHEGGGSMEQEQGWASSGVDGVSLLAACVLAALLHSPSVPCVATYLPRNTDLRELDLASDLARAAYASALSSAPHPNKGRPRARISGAGWSAIPVHVDWRADARYGDPDPVEADKEGAGADGVIGDGGVCVDAGDGADTAAGGAAQHSEQPRPLSQGARRKLRKATAAAGGAGGGGGAPSNFGAASVAVLTSAFGAGHLQESRSRGRGRRRGRVTMLGGVGPGGGDGECVGGQGQPAELGGGGRKVLGVLALLRIEADE